MRPRDVHVDLSAHDGTLAQPLPSGSHSLYHSLAGDKFKDVPETQELKGNNDLLVFTSLTRSARSTAVTSRPAPTSARPTPSPAPPSRRRARDPGAPHAATATHDFSVSGFAAGRLQHGARGVRAQQDRRRAGGRCGQGGRQVSRTAPAWSRAPLAPQTAPSPSLRRWRTRAPATARATAAPKARQDCRVPSESRSHLAGPAASLSQHV